MMANPQAPGLQILGPEFPCRERVLTREAQEFLCRLEREFGGRRKDLLTMRAERQCELDAGGSLGFLDRTRSVREGLWTVAAAPPDLDCRHVEITGPAERKMMINALNSGANVFMADFEDSLTPTWANVMTGQAACQEAVRRTLVFESAQGKKYALGERLATLVVRPRGWHLEESHLRVDGAPMSASLADFGLYVFHNARELLCRKSGPYFYLPKLESHLEARLWNDVFVFAQRQLGIPSGSIRATVLIETILAAFEMDEILYELRDHAAGLNAGRWDYIFSTIKTFGARKDLRLPDRSQITMAAPFMRAYADLLVQTCHRRGAHAIGGMAAFIPSRGNEQLNAIAIDKVTQDKRNEAENGFDGTWVAHPDLVSVARAQFDLVLGDRPHQKEQLRAEVQVTAEELLDFAIPQAQITSEGLRKNISVTLRYLDSWLDGTGAAAIDNLMEDTATAEISRAQIWQWIHHGATLADGRPVTLEIVREMRRQELDRLGQGSGHLTEAAEILDKLVSPAVCADFLTTMAYPLLD